MLIDMWFVDPDARPSLSLSLSLSRFLSQFCKTNHNQTGVSTKKRKKARSSYGFVNVQHVEIVGGG